MPAALLRRIPPPLALATVAVVLASAVVLYLQQQAMTTLRARNAIIERQLAEQVVNDIALELRRVVAGPVFETLAAVNHPDLRAGRLDLVAEQFVRGLARYPHIERFFAWTPIGPTDSASEVQFFGRGQTFETDAALGAAIQALAFRHASSQQIYIAAERVGDGARQVFLRLFWTDADRERYFAVLGFVVEPETMHRRLFDNGRGQTIDDILERRAGDLPLQVRVVNEHGQRVYGSLPIGAPGAQLALPMLFYPEDEIRSRLAVGVAPRPWTLAVGADSVTNDRVLAGRLYWPLAVPAALLLVAAALTIQAHRRAEELTAMQSSFVAHVSHQLKTPLALLTAATETLQLNRVRSPERVSEYLHTIHTEARKLSVLVQRVLEFSRVQQTRTLEREKVDMAALVRETVDAFGYGLDQPERFTVSVRGTIPLVEADPAALEQAVLNLLDNAVKYSPAGQPVTVTVFADRSWVTIEVADRGVGIAPADQKRIFERFVRVSGAGHREGFGLGLPIARGLVEAHGGRLDVSSVAGAGSTFRIHLRHAGDFVDLQPPEDAS